MTSLLGQDRQEQTLIEAAAGGRMHHGWILAGPRGIGKASFARRAALGLLATAADPLLAGRGLDVPADHFVARLFEAGTHPDYLELVRLEKDNGDLARNITVDQVRGLQRLFSNVPSLSPRRIVLIDSADELERSAANALLKNLEEPPSGTLFLLVSHAPARLLPTIRSRCRLLRFSPLADAEMREVLERNLPEASTEEINALIRAGQGAPGRALSFSGLDLEEIDRALFAIEATGDPDNRLRLALARKLATKSARPRYEAFLERAPAFLADAARSRRGSALRDALTGWEEARQIAGGAILLNLDPSSVVFELCSHVAALAGDRRAA